MHPQTANSESKPLTPPWWTYPYVWMILMGPVLVVMAALWTAYLAHHGADQVLMANSVGPALSAQQIKSNHATTRNEKGIESPVTPPLPLLQQTATHLGDRHE